jgi:hypothetical protein
MYAREGQLARLKRDMNNPKIYKFHRNLAHKKFRQIVAQMKDRKLMRLRWQLLNAHRNRDEKYVDKLVLQIRDYEKAEKDSGL